MAGVALHESAALFVPRVMLKWPNDLLVDGAKLAGILLEREDGAVVVGFGVNLAVAPSLGRPVISMADCCEAAPDPGQFVILLAEAFARRLAQWRSEGLSGIRRAWLSAAHPVGTALSTDAGEGLFEGIGEDGSLSLRLPDGRIRRIMAGEIFLL